MLKLRKVKTEHYQIDINAGECVGVLKIAKRWHIVHPQLPHDDSRATFAEAKEDALNHAAKLIGADYRFEYGKRWDATIPRSDVRWYVGRLHVSTPDTEITADISKRCTAPDYTPAIVKQTVAYALECHKRNRALFTAYRF